MGSATNTDLDLFAPLTKRERWHPNFARIAEFASEAERDTLRDWARGFRDRDGKFVVEFQTTFNSSFWELYLFALFRDAGCVLQQQHSRPDFVTVGGPLGDFTAEAVIASNPEGAAPEWTWDPTQPTADREAILDLACLRLSQALLAKNEKWKNGYSKLAHCRGRPFIVCIGPFEQPWASLQGTEAIDRVLFMGPRPVVSKIGDVTHVMGHAVTDAVFKESGARVPLGLFTDTRCSAISGVIFSSLATWSKVRALSSAEGRHVIFQAIRFDREGNCLANASGTAEEYSETLVDGAHLFLNPFAATPIEPDPFFEFGLAVHRFAPTGTITAVPHGLLISRVAYEVRTELEMPPPREGDVQRAQHRPASPPDGVPFGGPLVGPGTDQGTLELYRGWTLFVARDVSDGDWAAGAEPGTAQSFEAFRRLAGSDSAGFMTPFFPTRDEAASEARGRIDAILDGEVDGD